MINKLLSFLGFNTNDTYVGLKHLVEEQVKVAPAPVKVQPKELKLSDLMRGN